MYIYIYDCEWLQVKYIDRLSSLEAKVGAHRRGQFPGSGQAAGIPAGTAATGGLVCFLGVNTRLKIFLLQLFQYFLGSVYYFVRSNLKPETIISVHNFWDTLVIVSEKAQTRPMAAIWDRVTLRCFWLRMLALAVEGAAGRYLLLDADALCFARDAKSRHPAAQRWFPLPPGSTAVSSAAGKIRARKSWKSSISKFLCINCQTTNQDLIDWIPAWPRKMKSSENRRMPCLRAQVRMRCVGCDDGDGS